MSFVDAEDVMKAAERLTADVFRGFLGWSCPCRCRG